MTEGFSNDIFDGNGNLLVAGAQSPNFQAGVTGWQIRQDGSVEFNIGTFRGTINTSGDLLLYAPAPGAGNLIMSFSATGGTDSFGNNYPQGVNLRGLNGAFGNPGALKWNAGAGGEIDSLSGPLQLLKIGGPSGHQAFVNLGSDTVAALSRIQLFADAITLGTGGTDFGLEQRGTVAFTLLSGTNAVTGTVNFPQAFAASPVMKLTVQVGSNFDLLPNVQNVGVNSFGWRVFTKTGSNAATNEPGILHWEATG